MKKIVAFQSPDAVLDQLREPKHQDVKLLHKLLRRFGYLQSGTYEHGVFCACTATAVRRFQRFHKLTVDGIVGPETRTALLQPRCGLPDEIESARFVLRGCKYQTTQLTYTFLNDPSDLEVNLAQDIIRNAFDAWSQASPLQFTEVLPTEGPTFRIGWFSGEHGDGSAFDGIGNVIAHAFFPPPCGGVHAGDLHFDEDETFAESPDDGIHLGAVAIHEIGHLIGLGHSADTSAIMFPIYDPSRLTLRDDDVNGVQALYGPPRLRLSASATGRLNGRGDEQVFAIELPVAATLTLDGPDNADFDLYVKRDTPPTTNDFDFRAWTTAADEAIRFTPPTAGLYHILVRSYRGSGDFTLKILLD